MASKLTSSQTTGTTVTIASVPEDVAPLFDDTALLRQRLLTQFALHLDRYNDFAIEFLGEKLDPRSAIAERTTLDLAMPEQCAGQASFTIIEWTR